MLPASAMSSATFLDDIENEAGSRLHCLLSKEPCTSSTLIAADGVLNEKALRRSLEECLTTGPPTEEYSVVSVFDAGATTDQLVSVTALLLCASTVATRIYAWSSHCSLTANPWFLAVKVTLGACSSRRALLLVLSQ